MWRRATWLPTRSRRAPPQRPAARTRSRGVAWALVAARRAADPVMAPVAAGSARSRRSVWQAGRR